MKKIITLFCIALSMQNGDAQTKYADSLKAVLSATKNPVEQFDALHKMAEVRFRNPSKGLDSSDCLQMLRIAQDLKNDSLLAISYNWLGNYFSWKSDYQNALEYFLKGVPLAEKLNDKRRLSSLLIDISIIHHSLGNPIEVYRYLKLADTNLPEKTSPMFDFMDIQVKSLYAKYYLENGQADSALKYTQAANQVNLSLKSDFFSGMINALFGGVYEKLGDPELADLYFRKGLDIVDANPQFQIQKFQRMKYISFLLNRNLLKEAKIQSEKALSDGRHIGNKELVLAAAMSLQQIYDQTNQVDSAYYFLKTQSLVRDTLFDTEKMNRIQSLAFAEQLRTRDEELKNIRLAKKRTRQLQFMIIGIVIISLSVIYLLLSHSIVARENMIKFIGIIGLLIIFEFINLLLHPFLERVTRHSPIIMLMIMVFIAALLVPLHHRIEKWITEKMVQKNKRIRLEAARKTIERLGSQ